MENMGCQSIFIKDMAGIMGPQEAYDTVKALKENVKVTIILHTHSTTGLGIRPETRRLRSRFGYGRVERN